MAGILGINGDKRRLAEAILPHMDNPDMWEDPIPECFDAPHDWRIMEDDNLVIGCSKCSLTLVIMP